MTRVRRAVVVALILGATVGWSRSADAWGFKVGPKFYFKPNIDYMFRFAFTSDFRIAGPVGFFFETALDVNGDWLMGELIFGPKFWIPLGKIVSLTIAAGFEFGTATYFTPQDGFYALGGLFSPGIEINLKVIYLTIEASVQAGKFLAVDIPEIARESSPPFVGAALMVGISI